MPRATRPWLMPLPLYHLPLPLLLPPSLPLPLGALRGTGGDDDARRRTVPGAHARIGVGDSDVRLGLG